MLVINSNLSPSISKQTYFDFTDFQTAELRFKSTARLAPKILNSYDFCLRKQCGKVSPNRRVTIIKPFVNITSSWSWKQAISHEMQGIKFLGTQKHSLELQMSVRLMYNSLLVRKLSGESSTTINHYCSYTLHIVILMWLVFLCPASFFSLLKEH